MSSKSAHNARPIQVGSKKYPSIRVAADAIGVSHPSIHYALQKGTKVKGMKVAYLEVKGTDPMVRKLLRLAQEAFEDDDLELCAGLCSLVKVRVYR